MAKKTAHDPERLSLLTDLANPTMAVRTAIGTALFLRAFGWMPRCMHPRLLGIQIDADARAQRGRTPASLKPGIRRLWASVAKRFCHGSLSLLPKKPFPHAAWMSC
jgi:hypothetical protein